MSCDEEINQLLLLLVVKEQVLGKDSLGIISLELDLLQHLWDGENLLVSHSLSKLSVIEKLTLNEIPLAVRNFSVVSMLTRVLVDVASTIFASGT